jgi:RHS repeat-associated protein
VTVRASNGTLFGANTTWSTDSIVGTNGVADMNNDGRADLVTSPGTPNNVYVRLSSGTTFAAGAGTSWGAATGINMRAIDVTGDGKADLVDPTTTTVRIAGTGTFSAATVWAATSLTGPQGAIFGNIDGTGGNDVIGGSNTTNIQVRLSNNTTGFVAGNGFYEPFSFATKRYYMAGTVPVAVIDQANIGYHWLAGDTQGTTSLDVPDASGTAGITYQRYKPYGQQRGGDTITTTDHGFLGQIEDTTGLTYLNARYLDPVLGRFISVDPLIDLTRDAYGYASNNPITFMDPTGLGTTDLGQIAKASNSGVPGGNQPTAQSPASFPPPVLWPPVDYGSNGAPAGGLPWLDCVRNGSGDCGGPPDSAAFGSESEARDYTGAVVSFFDNAAGGLGLATDKSLVNVAAHMRDGVWIVGHQRSHYKAGLSSLSEILRARSGRYLAKSTGRVFLVLDAALTWTDDWKSTASSGQSTEWRALNATFHAGAKAGGSALGAWAAGAMAGALCSTGVGCLVVVAVAGGVGAWAGSKAGDEAFKWASK